MIPTASLAWNCWRDRKQGIIALHQSNYIRRMLDRYSMADCKPCKSPGDPRNKLTKDQCPQDEEEKRKLSAVPYREAVGSLMFLMVCSRPDIAYSVSRVAKFCDNPGHRTLDSSETNLQISSGNEESVYQLWQHAFTSCQQLE